ncbi:MAG: hypothetical protein FJ304_22130 [Planctomycetes bacterium]|nr:hypothetical protein [Planctomycetota bacterium]
MSDPQRQSTATASAEGVESQGQLDPTVPRHDDDALPRFAAPERAGEVGTLGRYRVLKKLGQGGMGAVYLGYDAVLGRKVALKVMLPQYAANAVARERFLREARTAAMVTSDHVVTIFDVDESIGVPFIAMEYLLGQPLNKYLNENGSLPLAQLVRIGRETALGLAAVHAVGLVHRDIKPGNLWLEAPNGRVKILDFGLARGTTDDVHLTSSGAVVGTVAYMAPEQGRGKKDLDHRADLFSLGVVLYRLATGTMPFTGDDVMAVLTSLAVDTPVSPRRLNSDLPPALEAVVMKLLAKNPPDRYQTATEVAAALQEIPTGPMPVVVAVPLTPFVVAAQTQNVWDGIDVSESVPIPLATSAEAAGEPAPTPKPPRAMQERKTSKWPAILASVGLVVAVAFLAAILLPKNKPQAGTATEPEPKPPAPNVHLPKAGDTREVEIAPA